MVSKGARAVASQYTGTGSATVLEIQGIKDSGIANCGTLTSYSELELAIARAQGCHKPDS